MHERRQSGGLKALLAVLALALLGVNAYLLLVPADIAPVFAEPQTPGSPTADPLKLRAPPPRGDVAQTTARPLFAASRRPAPDVSSATQAEADTRTTRSFPVLELRGIMLVGGRQQVLIRRDNDPVGRGFVSGRTLTAVALSACAAMSPRSIATGSGAPLP